MITERNDVLLPILALGDLPNGNNFTYEIWNLQTFNLKRYIESVLENAQVGTQLECEELEWFRYSRLTEPYSHPSCILTILTAVATAPAPTDILYG